MKKTITLLWIIVIGLFSCKEDKPIENEGTLEIVFKTEYDGTPLVLYENNITNETNPIEIRFKELEFFVSEIRAETDGNNVLLKDVEYIDLTGTTTIEKATEGKRILIEKIPVGNYTNLQILVGISDSLNKVIYGSEGV